MMRNLGMGGGCRIIPVYTTKRKKDGFPSKLTGEKIHARGVYPPRRGSGRGDRVSERRRCSGRGAPVHAGDTEKWGEDSGGRAGHGADIRCGDG